MTATTRTGTAEDVDEEPASRLGAAPRRRSRALAAAVAVLVLAGGLSLWLGLWDHAGDGSAGAGPATSSAAAAAPSVRGPAEAPTPPPPASAPPPATVPPVVEAAAVPTAATTAGPDASLSEAVRPPPRRRREGGPIPATEDLGSGPRGEPARLSVNAVPWAEVSVDGRRIGVTPLLGVRLPPGRHVLRLVNGPLGVERETPVVLAPGEHRELVVDLEPAREAPGLPRGLEP